MPPHLNLRLLGTPEVEIGTGNTSKGVTRRLLSKAQAILFYLAVTQTPHTRAALAALLWGDLPEAGARMNLRKALANLREVIAPFIAADARTIALAPDAVYSVDSLDFERGVERALSRIDDTASDNAALAADPAHLDALEAALALYRGDFLSGFQVRGAADFETWMYAEQERLRQIAIRGLDVLAEARWIHQAGPPRAIAALRRVLALEPWREATHARLMEWLARSGDRASALAQYETCVRVLDEELGVAPSRETRALYEQIRDGKIDPVPPVPPTRHEEPQQSTQQRTQQATQTHIAAPARPVLLPALPAPLVGRRRETAEVGELLMRPDVRLVTITGPGGVGKTSLALEVAYRLAALPVEADGSATGAHSGPSAGAPFRDGIVFVPLAPVDDTGELVARIVQAMQAAQITPEAAVGLASGDFRRTDLDLLLILDNFEQLLPAGTAALHEMLEEMPRLTLLVTSRTALNLRWEWRYDLVELAYPQNGTGGDTGTPHAARNYADFDAVRLFLATLQRSRAHRPTTNPATEREIRAAARICRLVGGLPLGIELSAAMAGKLSPETVAAELERSLAALAIGSRDLPERQRSLQATFDYSWSSLTPEEQDAFARLSFFRGSFTAGAAEAVAQAPLHVLGGLVDKSLLRPVEGRRYLIHEVLRRFAEERALVTLGTQDESAVRLAAYYLDLLHGWERRAAASPLAPELMDEILAELDHILLLCRWAVEHESPRELEIQAATDAFHSFVTNLYFVDEMHSAPDTRIGLSAERLISAAQRHSSPGGRPIHAQGDAQEHHDEASIYHLEISQLPHYAEYLLDLSESVGDDRADFLPVWIDECTVNGALVGLPYFSDIGMLCYRVDLLEKYGFSHPPATWDELEEMADTIQVGERAGPRGQPKRNFWGYVWQGKIGGSMLVNALIWQASHGGGVIVEAGTEDSPTISVNNERAAAGLQRAARWLGWISPPDSLVEHEIISMSRWYAGLAAFMHQWPGAFSYKNFVGNAEIRRVTRMVRMPSGGPAYAGAGRVGVLGGWPLTVARYAHDRDRAIAFVREAASYETQLRRVRENPWRFPTLTALYEEPEVMEAGPHFAEVKRLLADGLIVRPSRVSGPHYPELSRRYCETVQRILVGQIDAKSALADLERSLVALTGFRSGPPRANSGSGQ